MKESTIEIKVALDENHVPEALAWTATGNNESGNSEAMLLSLWDSHEKNSLRIDLWTKNMGVDDMNIFIHQSLLGLSDTMVRATGNSEASNELKQFALHFGQKLNILKRSDS